MIFSGSLCQFLLPTTEATLDLLCLPGDLNCLLSWSNLSVSSRTFKFDFYFDINIRKLRFFAFVFHFVVFKLSVLKAPLRISVIVKMVLRQKIKTKLFHLLNRTKRIDKHLCPKNLHLLVRVQPLAPGVRESPLKIARPQHPCTGLAFYLSNYERSASAKIRHCHK